MKKFISVLAISLLAGCATTGTPVPFSTIINSPDGKKLFASFKTEDERINRVGPISLYCKDTDSVCKRKEYKIDRARAKVSENIKKEQKELAVKIAKKYKIRPFSVSIELDADDYGKQVGATWDDARYYRYVASAISNNAPMHPVATALMAIGPIGPSSSAHCSTYITHNSTSYSISASGSIRCY